MEELRKIVRNYPVIDNHAHNLLLPTQLEAYEFLAITTEAQGTALSDTRTSLSHMRANKQLKELYGSHQDDWRSIIEARKMWVPDRSDELTKKSFAGIHTILMDDGLDKNTVQSFDWHEAFVSGTVRRIVRIEAVAEDILTNIVAPRFRTHGGSNSPLQHLFWTELKKSLQDAIQDPLVAGFKSVICYRSGLSVGKVSAKSDALDHAFMIDFTAGIRNRKFRIQTKALNDRLLRFTLDEISAVTDTPIKPIQFHTGLGDSDINLLLSDPSHLQPLIEEYPQIPFIILHSSYPYTRKAGYLACVYSNAYLDIGEVFPMLSRDGEEGIIRQALELVPGSKLLWSTDGHWFPETYWLANKQFRLALEKILCEYVHEGDLSTTQAIKLAKDIFFNNSNRVYNLKLDAPTISQKNPQQNFATDSSTISNQSPTPSTISDQSPPSTKYDLQLWERLKSQESNLGFVYVQWLDRMAQMRSRILPIKEFTRLIETNGQIGISKGNMGTLQNDGGTAVMTPIGQIHVRPDLRSWRPTHAEDTLRHRRRVSRMGPDIASATVMASWCDGAGLPLEMCHRSLVERLVTEMKELYETDMLIGFEIEVIFLFRHNDGHYMPYTEGQAWGTITSDQWQKLKVFRSMIDGLEDMGIDIQQFHAESGQGQYEFVLPPLPPVAAIDTLLQARQAIQQIASTHSLRATFHASPLPGFGTASHAHISLSPPTHSARFFAGVLRHLRAICAFTLPEAPSYARVADDVWTGGTWVAWGTQNRECPLRRIDEGRWEVRCLDGFANMYLAVAAVAGAGLLGCREGRELEMKDCRVSPSRLDAGQRAQLGILEKLPTKLEEALAALRGDKELAEVIGNELVEEFVVMKEAEQKMLGEMDETTRRMWLIEHY